MNQYYHRYVIAMLLGPVMDVILAIPGPYNDEARRDTDGEHAGHEGDLAAAYRLFNSLHATYGNFIDAFVLDALNANGTLDDSTGPLRLRRLHRPQTSWI